MILYKLLLRKVSLSYFRFNDSEGLVIWQALSKYSPKLLLYLLRRFFTLLFVFSLLTMSFIGRFCFYLWYEKEKLPTINYGC